jgi:hypothetical protein
MDLSWLPNEKTEGPHGIKNTVNSMLLMGNKKVSAGVTVELPAEA